MSELKYILEQPHQVWDNHTAPLSDYDKILVSWLKNGNWVSRNFNRKTLSKVGLCRNTSGEFEQKKDLRALNGGARSGAGARTKSEGEKKRLYPLYLEGDLIESSIKKFGSKANVDDAIKFFLNNHFI